MSLKGSQEKNVLKVINYLKEKTEESGEWIKLKMPDVAKIIDRSLGVCSLVMRDVAKDPRIESYEDPNSYGGANAKSKFYRYKKVEDKKPQKKETKEHETSLVYRNLTPEIVQMAETVLFENGVRTSNKLTKVLNVLNVYSSSSVDRSKNIISQIADLLVETEASIKESLEILMDSNLIERIELEPKKLKKITAEPIKETVAPASITIVEPIVHSKPVEVKEVEQLKAPEVIQENKDLDVLQIVSALTNFSDMQGQFLNYFKGLAESLPVNNNKEELFELNLQNNALSENLDKAHEVIQKLVDENSKIKNENKDKTEKIELANKAINAYREKTESVICHMQSRLEILIAEVSNAISNYTQVLVWERTPQKNAQFQSTVLNAVTAAVADIIEFNKSNGKEE